MKFFYFEIDWHQNEIKTKAKAKAKEKTFFVLFKNFFIVWLHHYSFTIPSAREISTHNSLATIDGVNELFDSKWNRIFRTIFMKQNVMTQSRQRESKQKNLFLSTNTIAVHHQRHSVYLIAHFISFYFRNKCVTGIVDSFSFAHMRFMFIHKQICYVQAYDLCSANRKARKQRIKWNQNNKCNSNVFFGTILWLVFVFNCKSFDSTFIFLSFAHSYFVRHFSV